MFGAVLDILELCTSLSSTFVVDIGINLEHHLTATADLGMSLVIVLGAERDIELG